MGKTLTRTQSFIKQRFAEVVSVVDFGWIITLWGRRVSNGNVRMNPCYLRFQEKGIEHWNVSRQGSDKKAGPFLTLPLLSG
jgi:hypothetical protein